MKSIPMVVMKGRFLSSFLAFAGFGLGLLIVLCAVQVGVLAPELKKALFPNADRADAFIVSKKVNAAHSFNAVGLGFDQAEARELAQVSGVIKVAPFVQNRFTVRAILPFGTTQYHTEMFLESVDQSFLDVDPSAMSWQVGQAIVPVVMARDFISLYNFVFARARNLPVITPEVLPNLPLRFELQGPGGSAVLEARIVALSDWIPSVLVPKSFMDWANRTLALVPEPEAVRLAVQLADGSAPAFRDFLNHKDWETTRRLFDLGEAQAVLGLVLSLVLFLGAAFVILSMVLLAAAFRLVLVNASQDIVLLRDIGWRPLELLRPLALRAAWGLSLAAAFALLATGFLLALAGQILTGAGIALDFGLQPAVMVAGLLIPAGGFALVLVVSLAGMRRV